MDEKQYSGVELDLKVLIDLLLDRWWMILTVTVAAMVSAFVYTTAFITPMYTTTAELYIMPNYKEQINSSDISVATSLTSDYNHFVTGRRVLEEVIEVLDLDMSYGALRGSISVSNPANTRFLIITVSNNNPVQAQRIANSICEVASVRITELLGVEQVSITENAYLPSAPSSPNKTKNTFLGGVAGFVLTSGIVILIYLLDDKLKSDEDIKRQLGLTTLGIIPCQNKKEA